MSFKPMLACSKIPALTNISYPVYASPKLDGIRCIIGEDGKAYSRNMKLIPNKHVQQTLQELQLPQLDGELMVTGGFNSVQSAIMSRTGEPSFYYNVFDTCAVGVPFKLRTEFVTKYVQKLASLKVKSLRHNWIENQEQLDEYWKTCITLGYEGVIVRSPYGPYKQGRSTMREGYMLKLKKFREDEAVITGYEELMRNSDTSTKQLNNMYGASMLGALTVTWHNVEFNIGSGFDQATRIQLWHNPEALINKTVTFKYQEVSEYGVPRFPTFKAFREGY